MVFACEAVDRAPPEPGNLGMLMAAILGLEATDNNALAFAENTLAMFPLKIASCSKSPSNLG